MKFITIILLLSSALLADPVEQLLINDMDRVEFDEVEVSVVNSTTGHCSDILNQKSVPLNFAILSKSKVVTFGYSNKDVVGPFLFRHVPAIPAAEFFKEKAHLREFILILGLPHLDSGGVAEWAFFCRIQNEYKFLFLVVHHRDDGNVVGVRTGEGKFSFMGDEK
jgi:hypothetical protein